MICKINKTTKEFTFTLTLEEAACLCVDIEDFQPDTTTVSDDIARFICHFLKEVDNGKS